MRRMSLVLIALGAFLIVLGPMIRWYAYPRLAVAPANQRSETGLVGNDATIFDIATLKEITTTLHTVVNTTGDATTPSRCPGAVTYVNSTSTQSSDGVMRSRDVERMTFDARSGQAVSCGNDFVSGEQGVETKLVHHGLVAKFPFQTEKKTYQFWDNTLKRTIPIKYLGTTKIENLTVYKFGQTIAPTQYGEQKVPLSLLGLPGDTQVTAPMMYSNNRTLLVEPETGVIIKRTEAQNNTLDYEGQPRITLTKAVVGYDDKSIRKNIDDYGAQGSMLHLVRVVVPQVGFVLGLLVLIAGVVLGRRRAPVVGTRSRELQHA